MGDDHLGMVTVHVWHVGKDDERVQELLDELTYRGYRVEEDVLSFSCSQRGLVDNLRLVRFSDAVTDSITIRLGDFYSNGDIIAEDWWDIRLRWPSVDERPPGEDTISLGPLPKESSDAVRSVVGRMSHLEALVQYYQKTIQDLLEDLRRLKEEGDVSEEELDSLESHLRSRAKRADRLTKQ